MNSSIDSEKKPSRTVLRSHVLFSRYDNFCEVTLKITFFFQRNWLSRVFFWHDSLNLIMRKIQQNQNELEICISVYILVAATRYCNTYLLKQNTYIYSAGIEIWYFVVRCDNLAHTGRGRWSRRAWWLAQKAVTVPFLIIVSILCLAFRTWNSAQNSRKQTLIW